MTSCPNTQSGVDWGQARLTGSSYGGFRYSSSWGSGVDAFIVDTGVQCGHSEFGGRCEWGNACAGCTAQDLHGHGTHVAGTVGGATYGIAKSVHIIAVKVLGDNGQGSNSQVIAGLQYVAQRKRRPSVVNMSLGGASVSQALNSAASSLATTHNVAIAIAAGNDNANAAGYSPASASNIVTVGSTDSSDRRSSFSNYGSVLEIFAPGSSIKSANFQGGFSIKSGTSMACPHVTGVMAVHLSEVGRDVPFNEMLNWLQSNAVYGRVVDPKGSPNYLLQIPCGGGSTTPSTPTTPVTPPSNGQCDPNGCYGYSCDGFLAAHAGYTCSTILSWNTCNCAGCRCGGSGSNPTPPTPRSTPAPPTGGGSCKPNGCYGYSCDGFLAAHPGYDCNNILSWNTCDCTGCKCGGGSGVAPTPPRSTVCDPQGCRGHSCEYYKSYGYSCAELEGKYGCHCSGCRC